MNVLIADDAHELLIETLVDWGCKVNYQPDITNSSVLDIIKDYEIIIVSTKTIIDKKLINLAINLRFILRMGSGLDTIDVAYAQTKNIQCFASPEGNCNAVAEHTVGMLLAITKNIHRSANEVKKMIWKREENRGTELMNKTISIIGVGHTGGAVAKRLSGFDATMLGVDIFKNNITTSYLKQAEMKEVFEQSDVVTLHLPLTHETFHFANAAFFNSFHKSIILLNASRGNVVSMPDLLAALHSGKVVGAGLDVLENEKMETLTTEETSQLTTLQAHQNVLITPHIAGWSIESKRNIAAVILSKIAPYINHNNVI